MKVILDVAPIKFPLTGIGRYTYELATRLPEMQEMQELMLWANFNKVEKLPESADPSNAPGSNSAKQKIFKSSKAMLRKLALSSEISLELYHKLKSSRLKTFKDYVYHGPNFYLPRFPGASVVTIHDLSTTLHPEYHPADRVRFIEKAIKDSLKTADMILAVSKFGQQEIARVLSWPIEKIQVTQLAASDAFRPHESAELLPVLQTYKLTEKSYTLFAGTVEPRKNLEVLLDAYEHIPDALRKAFPLVVSGFAGWHSTGLHERMAQGERQGWLRYLGYTPAEALPVLVAGAALFMFPSFYEGFGLPPLEAMASGTPVLTSNRASLPEVVGDAAPQLDPLNWEIWRDSIVQALEDKAWRDDLSRKGLEQSRKFSWDRCVEETITGYRRALGK